MRRVMALLMLLGMGFLSACFLQPTPIVERVPETVIVTALIQVPLDGPSTQSTPPPLITAPIGAIASSLANAVVTADLLNLRSEPDVGSQLIATLEKGLAIQVLGRSGEGDWLQVKYHTVEGWVAAQYLELSVPFDDIRIVNGEGEAVAGTTPLPADQGPLAQVLRVLDGSRIEVSIGDEPQEVRYIGIDVSQMAEQALAENVRLVGEKSVILEQDSVDTDDQGRLLRYVWLGDLMVNAELLRLGYARVSTDPPDIKYLDLFRRWEGEAREAKLGLWETFTATVELTTTATATLTPTIPVLPACPDGRSRLTYPYQMARLDGAVEIRGSANVVDFDYYKFEFRAEAGDWSFVSRFDAPVADGALGWWDVSALAPGAYDFRLVVVDRSGNYPDPCEVRVLVEH